VGGPYFGNEVATIVLSGRHAEVQLQRADPDGDTDLVDVARLDLTGARLTR
jgi:hypothetical protein